MSLNPKDPVIEVTEGQFRGHLIRYNYTDFSRVVEVPPGRYRRNGDVLILMHGDTERSLSSKHAYRVVD